ncbi:MAG: hypothetical protein JSW10_07015 [Pseudomonadota bacterium]|nr:MAG: hypothetical protein JSW10_07015 [Pseudomonadota bacterium]
MPTEADPIVDNWYAHLDKGQRFLVVAVDDINGLVEIQHFDGNIEELDFEQWYLLDVETSEAPENWIGALDIAEADDLGTEITDTSAADWSAPLTEVKQPGNDELSEDEDDEWGEGLPEEELRSDIDEA